MKKAMVAFYICMVAVPLACLVAAISYEAKTSDGIALYYAPMSPELRASEYEALRNEVKEPLMSARHYFTILFRLERLERACERADREEKGEAAYQARIMYGGVHLWETDWANKLHQSSIPNFDDFRTTRDEMIAGKDNPERATSNVWPRDPRANLYWFLFYFGMMPFVLVHYSIRLRSRQCRIWPELVSNWKFPLWVLIWPVGLFKYPRDINPVLQLQLMWRRLQYVGSLLVSSAISFFALAPAAVGQKTDPETEQRHTLHVDVTTLSLPEYLGANGGVFHPAPVEQTSMTVSLPKGFYVGLWNSVSLADRLRKPNFGNEVDYSAGWNGTLKHFAISFDATCINVTPLSKVDGDVMLYTLKTGRTFAFKKRFSATPFFEWQGVAPIIGSKPKAGMFLHAGGDLGWTVTRRFGIGATTEIIHDSGALGFDRGFFTKASLNGTWKISNHWAMQFPVVRFATPLSHFTDGRNTQLIMGGGMSFHY